MVQDRRSTFEPYWVGRAGRTTGGTREGLPLLRGLPGGQEAGLGPWNSAPPSLPLPGTLTRGGAPARASARLGSVRGASRPSAPACPTRPSSARRWRAAAPRSGTCSPPGPTSPPRHTQAATVMLKLPTHHRVCSVRPPQASEPPSSPTPGSPRYPSSRSGRGRAAQGPHCPVPGPWQPRLLTLMM